MNQAKVLLLQSYICVASISAAMISPALPYIQKTFAVTQGSVGWVMSIFLLGYVFGQLIYGPIANRFGRLNALRLGLVINLLGIITCLIAVAMHSYYLLLVGRLITALGSAAGLSCTFILMNELLSSDQAKRAMGMSMVFFTLGLGLSVTISGIITQYFQWQYCFVILLIHGSLILISTWQFPETLKVPQTLRISSILLGYRKALESRQLIKYALVIGFTPVVSYCYATAAPVYAHSILHLTPSHYSYWNLMNNVGMLSSGFLSVYLMKRWSAQKVLQFSLMLLIPCLFSLLLLSLSASPHVIWFFTTTLFLYLFSGLLFPAGSFLASNAISDKANASSIMSFLYMGCAMLCVIFMGYLPVATLSAFTAILLLYYLLLICILFWKNFVFKKVVPQLVP